MTIVAIEMVVSYHITSSSSNSSNSSNNISNTNNKSKNYISYNDDVVATVALLLMLAKAISGM